MPRLITIARITGLAFLAVLAFTLTANSPAADNPLTKLAAFGAVALVLCVLVYATIWHDWFSHPMTDPPKRSRSHSLARHGAGQAAMARWFRRYATRPGSLPDPPKPASHDADFLAAWQAGDLGECDRRLDLLAGEMDRREGPEVSRLLHYQRCLERARKAAWAATRPDRRTSSVLDEID